MDMHLLADRLERLSNVYAVRPHTEIQVIGACLGAAGDELNRWSTKVEQLQKDQGDA
jgi:hypothetical protein